MVKNFLTTSTLDHRPSFNHEDGLCCAEADIYVIFGQQMFHFAAADVSFCMGFFPGIPSMYCFSISLLILLVENVSS